MRLIDADALWAKMKEYYEKRVEEANMTGDMMVGVTWHDAVILIKSAPTVDVVPVRHAKWIPKITKIGGIDWPSGMKCSGCGEDALNAEGTDFLTDFCPHCGARMDEE